MNVAVAFKAAYPGLIADYLASREIAVAKFHAKVDAFKTTIGGREVFGTSFYDGGWAVQGFRTTKPFEDIPAGWRRQGQHDVVPAKRTPEGKEIAAELASLRLAGDSYPGCPDILFDECFSIFPRVDKVGDDYFLTLSRIPLEKESNALDSEIWEPVKLSEYHAAIENAEVLVEA